MLRSYEKIRSFIRRIAFLSDDSLLAVSTSDGLLRLFSVDSLELVKKIHHSNSIPITAIKSLNDRQFVTGDEGGLLQLWNCSPAARVQQEWACCGDQILEVATAERDNLIFTCSGDGTMNVIMGNSKSKSIFAQYVVPKDAIYSSLVVCGDSKFVAAAGDAGRVEIFNWDDWGECWRRIEGHDGSPIDSIVKVSEQYLATGASDGLIRLIRLQPLFSVVGTIGRHEENLSVESLVSFDDGRFIASIAHDCQVCVWNVEAFLSSLSAGEEKKKQRQKQRQKEDMVNLFFSGIS